MKKIIFALLLTSVFSFTLIKSDGDKIPSSIVKKLDGTPLYAAFYANTNTIALSETRLKNASIEFIAIAIIHELFHAMTAAAFICHFIAAVLTVFTKN